MQYSVPQFIDVENKIFGPVSVRQFLILVAAIAIMFISFQLADVGLFIIIAIFTLTFTIVFAFVRINGRPFHYFVLNFVQSAKSPHLRVWSKEVLTRLPKEKKKKKEKGKSKEAVINYVQVTRHKQETRSRLSDLSLLVDTGGYFKKT